MATFEVTFKLPKIGTSIKTVEFGPLDLGKLTEDQLDTYVSEYRQAVFDMARERREIMEGKRGPKVGKANEQLPDDNPDDEQHAGQGQ